MESLTLSLTGHHSHQLKLEPGVGSLSIGTIDSPFGKADLVVTPNAKICWTVFSQFTVPAGGNWPRWLYYEGNDTSIFDWTAERELERLDWAPLTDVSADASKSKILDLSVYLRQGVAVRLVLPTAPGTRGIGFSGPLDSLTAVVAPGARVPDRLRLAPATLADSTTAPLQLPGLQTFSEITILHVHNQPMRQAIDARSLLQFQGLKHLSLWGAFTGLDALADLPNLEGLGLRYMPDLTHLPTLTSWPNLKSVIAWNVDETAGKSLRAQFRAHAKNAEEPYEFASARQLRKPAWFQTEYGLPFSAWPAPMAKAATRAYRAAEAAMPSVATSEEARTVIHMFVKALNRLKRMETSERDDAGQVVSMLAALAPLTLADAHQSWFDEIRDF